MEERERERERVMDSVMVVQMMNEVDVMKQDVYSKDLMMHTVVVTLFFICVRITKALASLMALEKLCKSKSNQLPVLKTSIS